MFHDVTLLPEERICIVTFHEGWDTPEGIEARADDVLRILEETRDPLYFIMDLSQVRMTVDGVMQSANRMTRGPNAPFHHPMCRAVALVTSERIAKMVALGLQTEAFGHVNVCACNNLAEALEHARGS